MDSLIEDETGRSGFLPQHSSLYVKVANVLYSRNEQSFLQLNFSKWFFNLVNVLYLNNRRSTSSIIHLTMRHNYHLGRHGTLRTSLLWPAPIHPATYWFFVSTLGLFLGVLVETFT